MPMTTAIAERALQGAKAKALQMGVRVAIAVVDARGDLWAMVRLDGARWTVSEVCRGKAFAAATFGRPSGELTANAGSPVIQAIIAMQGGRLIPAQGAVPLIEEGQVIGAVGVSGAASSEDEEIAAAGAKAL
ncbi:MAG: heme-binding protein [Chloroflexi bacterium]|nr:heme-binding protein [Chloroflexota bacterium]